MTRHARLPPSTSARWKVCPASVAAPEPRWPAPSEPPDEPSPAMIGTAAHAVLELVLKDDVGTMSPRDYFGEVVSLDGGGEVLGVGALPLPGAWAVVEVTDVMAHAVDAAVDYVRGRVAEGAELVAVERRLRVLTSRDDCWGTADVVLRGPGDLLEVVDYKNGRVRVEHEDNSQLLSYLLAASRLDADARTTFTYRGTIVQPNADDDPVRWCEYSPQDLAAHEAALERAAALADEFSGLPVDLLDGEVGLVVAGSHCAYCPQAYACPALAREVSTAAAADFSEEPPPDGVEVPEGLDAPALARALAWVPVMRAWAADVEATAARYVALGGGLPGYSLTTTPGRRRPKAGVDLLAAFEASGGDPSLFQRPRTPRELASLLPPKLRAGFLGAVTTEGEPRPRLVRVRVDVARDFDD